MKMILSDDTENFFGKRAKERRQKRRESRERRREAKTRRKEARAQIVEQKAQERGLDNQAKQGQIVATQELSRQEIQGVQPLNQQNAMMPNNRNTIIGVVVVGVLLLVGAVIFFITKKQ
ncbi:MAG: hypothetical protein MUC49_02295 [Raineya sp.]|jgi:hypothetical protein|nr:hypothetical protein [Raineya sp.]